MNFVHEKAVNLIQYNLSVRVLLSVKNPFQSFFHKKITQIDINRQKVLSILKFRYNFGWYLRTSDSWRICKLENPVPSSQSTTHSPDITRPQTFAYISEDISKFEKQKAMQGNLQHKSR